MGFRRLLAGLSLLVAAACAGRHTGERASAARPRTPAPSAGTALSSVAAVQAQPAPEAAADGGAPPEPAVVTDTAPPEAVAPNVSTASIQLVIEPPYAPGRRPRPSGELAAAGDDELVARWNMGGNGDPAYAPNQPTFHPGTRVVVNARVIYPRLPSGAPGKKSRGLTARHVLAQARSRGYWPFRVCYEQGLREKPGLAGETRLRITIGASGKVAGARLLGSELAQKSAAACVVRKARSLRFEPAPGRKVDVDLSVEFWPGDAALPEAPSGGPDLERDAQRRLEASLREAESELAACYAAGLERDRALWGRIALRAVPNAAGTRVAFEEHDSRFPDGAVVACVKGVLSRTLASDAGREAFVVALRLGTPPAAGEPEPRESAPAAEPARAK